MTQKQSQNKKKEFESIDIPLEKISFLSPFWQPRVLLLRLDRPVGILLALFSGFLGLFGGAYPSFPMGRDIFLFALGAIIMRGIGCILNDLWDKEIDAQVHRTHMRPLAKKTISVKDAVIFLFFLLAIGFCILIQFNFKTICLGILVVFLAGIYPFMKRITYWPQLFLGITFNWGILMGWASQGKPLDAACFILYGATILWTLGYDTIYAYQDVEDDAFIGIKSSALCLKKYAKYFLGCIYGGALSLFYAFGVFMNLGALYKGACLFAGLQFCWQVIMLDLDVPKDCLKKFKSNVWVGAIFFLALALREVLG